MVFEVVDDHRAAVAAPEATLARFHDWHARRLRQCVAHAKPERCEEDEVGAVGLLVEDQIDRLGLEEADTIEFAAVRHDGLRAGRRTGIAVSVGRTDLGRAPFIGPGRLLSLIHISEPTRPY